MVHGFIVNINGLPESSTEQAALKTKTKRQTTTRTKNKKEITKCKSSHM